MSFGKYTYSDGNPKVFYRNNDAKLVVGKFCSIASGVNIYLGGNHRTDWVTTYPFGHINQDKFTDFNGVGHPSTKGNIIIGNDVYIGQNATIMSGVTIGDGAIIGSHSLVTKNVEPYTIIGGVPAKKIRMRFNDEIISALIRYKWWNYSENKIMEKISLFNRNLNIEVCRYLINNNK